MKNEKFVSSCILVFLCICLLTAGCNGSKSDSEMVRRAQLVGHENLKLKKDIADKDRQIAELTQEVEKAKAENAAIEQNHGDIYKRLLDIISECQGKLEKSEGKESEGRSQKTE